MRVRSVRVYADNETYRVLRGLVTPLSLMKQSRLRPGFLLFHCNLYLFGGRDEGDRPQKASERLSLASLQWQSISPMLSGRAEFNPCFLRNCFYLCGGYCDDVEKYDPVADIFTYLRMVYGNSGSRYTQSTCAVAEDDNLTIIYQTGLWKLDLDRKKLAVFKLSMREVYSCTLPMLYNGKVYLTTIEKGPKCSIIDLKTAKFIVEISIPSN